MDWIREDWEYPNDIIYAIERQKDIEASWEKEEEEQRKKRLPAIIKVIKPIEKNETNLRPTTV